MNRRAFIKVLTGSIAFLAAPKIHYAEQDRTAHTARKILRFARAYGFTETGRYVEARNFHAQQANASFHRPGVMLIESDYAEAEKRCAAFVAETSIITP